MLVWSILMILVSQFFKPTDHVVFYIFASICNLILPVVTSVYSTTGGRHGAGLLRVGYVFCDPVLASITVVPILLLNRLPDIVDDIVCLASSPTFTNNTIICLQNSTILRKFSGVAAETWNRHRMELYYEKRISLLIVQCCLICPALLVLSMGRRTRKMNLPTSLLVFCYWFIAGIEAAHMIETAVLGERYVHFVYTTETIVSVVMIIANSYAIVTLCSYISPMGCRDELAANSRFDFLYKVVMGVTGLVFVEIPQLVARCQILAAGPSDPYNLLSGVFYLWMIKDILFIPLILTLLLLQKMGSSQIVNAIRAPCAVNFDNPDVFFQPEKRDAYIVRHKQVSYRDKTVNKSRDRDNPAHRLILTEHGNPVSTTEDSSSSSDHARRKTKHVTFKSDCVVQVHPSAAKPCMEKDTGV